MNEKAKERSFLRLISSTIRSHNREISILLFASVNLIGILYPFFNLFERIISSIVYGGVAMMNTRLFIFLILYIPISIFSLLYLISKLSKKSAWILVLFILGLTIADYIYILSLHGSYLGLNEWLKFKLGFLEDVFGKYFQFLFCYSISGIIFVLFKSRKKERVSGNEA
jgi:hypothetical protein